MIAFRCPKCQMKLRASEEKAGATVACSECGQRLVVPKPAGASSAPSKSKALSDSGSGSGIRKRRMQDDEDEQEVRRPRRPAKKSVEPEKSSSAMPLLVGGIAAGAAVLLIGVVVAVVALSGKSDKSDKPKGQLPAGYTEQSAPPPGGMPPPPPPPLAFNAAKTETVAAKSDIPEVLKHHASAGHNVFQHVLKSVAFVFARGTKKQLWSGSGTLVDLRNHLVLTNNHVAEGAKELLIFFPMHEHGKLVTDPTRYIQRAMAGDAILARVVDRDPKRDLALLQCDKLPDGVEPLALAASSPAVSQTVHSVGSPGASEAFWNYTVGTVRAVYAKSWKVKSHEGEKPVELEAQVVETTSPTNHGDSGGPLVNDNGELVAVTQGGISGPDVNLISIFIDVTEARDFIEKACREHQMVWHKSTRTVRTMGNANDVPELIACLSHQDENVRSKAAEMLGTIGPDAKKAVRPLMQLVRDEKSDGVRQQAVKALDEIGAPERSEVRPLVDALKSLGNNDLRRYAARALGKLGYEGRVALPELVRAAKDSDPGLRRNAILSLGTLGTQSRDTVLPILKDASNDEDHDVRVAAAEALTGKAFLTKDSMPVLLEMLKSQDPEPRAVAARAIGRLGHAAASAVPALAELVSGSDFEVRKAVIEALGNQGADAKGAVSALTTALGDSDSNIRELACKALGKIGPDAKSAGPAVAHLLETESLEGKKLAMTTLGKIGANDRESIEALKNIAKGVDFEQQLVAISALGDMGPAAKSAVPDLLMEVMQSRYKEVHQKTVQALVKIIKGQKVVNEMMPALKRAVAADSIHVRLGAVEVIGDIGPDAKAARQRLVQLQQVEIVLEVRTAIAEALGKISAK